jgi:hypothetical protein
MPELRNSGAEGKLDLAGDRKWNPPTIKHLKEVSETGLNFGSVNIDVFFGGS